MDGILKALGFDSKPDYTEKIPETLTPDHFYVHNTFHHGFPDQPTCLDYDPVQQLLAVGAQNGRVLLLGKPGLEQYIIHPNNEHVLQMKFISNKGLLITMCDPRTLYLWSLKEKNPCILHTLELNKERPTCISHTCGSDWIYVGTDAGNVHVVHIHTFKISGFTIYWNHALDVSYRGSPGEVKSVEEHPMDQGKVLISFGCGYCVLYDMKCNNSQAVKDARVDPHKRFCYDPGHSHVLTSTCWLGNGRYFVCAYSNGCVVQWNIKVDSKPEKIFFIHETPDPSAFKPVYKIQVVHTDGEHPWYLCSGGFPEESSEAPRTLSVLRGKSISMLSSSSTILDFVCLPSSPYPYQCQKPFALVVLSKNELIFYDLLTPTFPKFDCSLLPYALDIHHPPVSSVYYCANCPEEFVGQLHSVRSKTVTAHAKPWPLKGGKWGQEVPHVSTDLILTGHTDGSVRLWYCSSVVLQPFFTLHTNTYFKMNYQPSTINLKSPPAGDASSVPQDGRKRVPPSRPPPPSKPPPRSLKSQVSQPTNTHSSAEAGNTTESNVSKSTSHPQLSISIPEAEIHVESQDQRISNTPSPATGQLRPESQELIDGGEATATRVGSPEGDRRTVFSREKKSIFKKRKNDDSNGTKLDVSPSGKDERKFSPKLSSKSFRKVAKIVKLSGGVRKSKKSVAVKEEGQEELDGREQSTESEEALSPAHSQAKADHQDPSTSPKRPTDITLRQVSTTETVMTTASSTPSDILTNNSETARHVQRSSSSSSDDFIHVPLPPQASNDSSNPSQTRSKTPQAQKIPTLPKLSETEETSSSPPPMFSTDPHSQFMEGEEFFSINEMHICICGQWLCVSNTGGIAMAFDFRLKNTEKKIPKYLEVNFDSDSVVKQYVPGSASTPKSSTSMSPSASPAPLSPGFQSYGQWVFEEKVHDVKPGFQLMQVVLCSSHSSNSSSGSASGRGSAASTTSGGRKPIMISSMQYSIDIGLLAIGTNSGFVVIDTFSNTCLCTLSSLTSILYMADPSRFTRQMKRESQLSLAEPRKATIKRHATSMAFSVKVKEGAESPTKRVQSAKMFTTTPRAQSQPHFTAAAVNTDEHDGMITLSELDSCVSALEIVQLQLDKQTLPTLTLWVGLASGYVVAYGINIMKGEEQDGTKRKIELVPTRFIIETGKSPIVGLFFLNMWGDCQVVPYHPRRTLSVSSEEKLEDAIKRVRNRVQQQQKEQSPSNCPQHYAIIVDETQIKSFSFPGFNKINNCVPPFPKESVILRSEYFSCQDLPCLLSVTSCHHLLVHSLPGLKPLMKLQYSPLCEAMAMCTFRVSGMGQALYMCSHSEIQRLSIVKEDMLNLPNCLPSLYVSIKDPPQTPSSKGLLGGLFASAPTAINQTLLFGESARRPVGNLYKLDGKTGTVYSGREIETTRVRRGKGTESNRGAERDQISHRKGGSKGVSGQMERNVEALHLRKEKLSNIEERTAEVADHASEFASMAARLAKKYEKR